MNVLENMYFVNEDGQVEINFDSLELITSIEFVELIKKEIHLDSGNYIKKVYVQEYKNKISVFIYESALIHDFNYWPEDGYISYDCVGEHVINMLGGSMHG